MNEEVKVWGKEGTSNDAFFSYQWDSKEQIIKLEEALTKKRISHIA